MYMERDLYMWKETYIHGKRPIYMQRDVQQRLVLKKGEEVTTPRW